MNNAPQHNEHRLQLRQRLRQRVKIHREGTNILLVLAAMLLSVNAVVWLFLPPWILPGLCSAVSLVCYGFVFNFFRCPNRKYRGELKDMVCSPGGTTIQAVKVLEEKGLRAAVMDAMDACIEKSKCM